MRSILITGCSSGIGLDAARTLHARPGWRVFATCRKEADAERLRDEGMESFRLDYSDGASVRAALDEALARAPDSLVLLRVLAGLQEKAGDFEGALATLARIVAVAPSDVEAWLRKGMLERTAGRPEDALVSLCRVYELDQRAPALLVDIGGLELAGGDAEAAVASFEAARAAGVRENALTLGLARAYALLGRVEDARTLLEGAPELGRAGEVLLEELAADALR